MKEFLKSTVFISFLATIVVIFTSLYLFFSSFKEDWVEEDYDVECFNELEQALHKYSTPQNLSMMINCFEWDSVALLERTYRDYMHLNFKIIRTNIENGAPGLDWIDGGRHWSYLYFYNKGKLLNDAIAIPDLYLNYQLSLPNSIKRPAHTYKLRPTTSLLRGKWMICERIYKGVSTTANVCSDMLFVNDSLAVLRLPDNREVDYRWEIDGMSINFELIDNHAQSDFLPANKYEVKLSKTGRDFKMIMLSEDSVTYVYRK